MAMAAGSDEFTALNPIEDGAVSCKHTSEKIKELYASLLDGEKRVQSLSDKRDSLQKDADSIEREITELELSLKNAKNRLKKKRQDIKDVEQDLEKIQSYLAPIWQQFEEERGQVKKDE